MSEEYPHADRREINQRRQHGAELVLTDAGFMEFDLAQDLVDGLVQTFPYSLMADDGYLPRAEMIAALALLYHLDSIPADHPRAALCEHAYDDLLGVLERQRAEAGDWSKKDDWMFQRLASKPKLAGDATGLSRVAMLGMSHRAAGLASVALIEFYADKMGANAEINPHTLAETLTRNLSEADDKALAQEMAVTPPSDADEPICIVLALARAYQSLKAEARGDIEPLRRARLNIPEEWLLVLEALNVCVHFARLHGSMAGEAKLALVERVAASISGDLCELECDGDGQDGECEGARRAGNE